MQINNYLTGKTSYSLKNNLLEQNIDINKIIKNIPNKQRRLDPVGILEILTKSYLIEDRTLVQGVQRYPWLEIGNDIKLELPVHGYKIDTVENIAKGFKDVLLEEMQIYLEGKKTVGILLSGGLDSRIVAGILKELKNNKIYIGDIVALTWGVENSRDVQYAEQIAKSFDWDWIHLDNSPELLKHNINVSAFLGAEVSPLHLHAIDKIADIDGIDTIIAGSYGDSVGRAEFSGIKVENLKTFLPYKKNLNKFGLIKQTAIDSLYNEIHNDCYQYRNEFHREQEYQYREVEQEYHYMRRKLQTVFIPIMKKKNFYQLFTNPKSFGFMWNLNPSVRTNEVYLELFKLLPGKLNEVAWARDGKILLNNSSNIDKLEKEHHKYGLWLRNELRHDILDLVNSNEIRSIGLFNEKALDNLIKHWSLSKTVSINSVDETLSWLASLSLFIKNNNINTNVEYNKSFRDNINIMKGNFYTLAYLTARNYKRA